MKLWIRTQIIGTGTDEDPIRPYLPVSLPHSMIELEDGTCLVRISGNPADIQTVIDDTNITVLTDEEAESLIKSKYPDAELENLDIYDLEVDEIAKSLGLDPHEIRRDIQIPEVGNQLLQDQENYLMAHICEKLGITQQDWDNKAVQSGKWQKGKDIELDIKRGRIEAHEFVLNEVRGRLNA